MNIQKQISIWICMALCAILLIGCAGTAPQDTSVISDVSEAEAIETGVTNPDVMKTENFRETNQDVESIRSASDVKLHFLCVTDDDAGRDLILIESGGEFGFVDCGTFAAREQTLSIMDDLGVTPDNLKFIIGTHAHGDHIGLMDHLIYRYRPERVYLMPFTKDDMVNPDEWKDVSWENAMKQADACKVPVIDTFEEGASEEPWINKNRKNRYTASPHFKFGDAQIDIYNYSQQYHESKVVNANDTSLVVKLTAGGHTALLTGDLSNARGIGDDPGYDEAAIADEIGHVDILKLPHHGSGFYNTMRPLDLKKFSASYLIQTGPTHFIFTGKNQYGKVKCFSEVLREVKMGAKYVSTFWYDKRIIGSAGLGAITFDMTTLENNIPTNYSIMALDQDGRSYMFRGGRLADFTLDDGDVYISNGRRNKAGYITADDIVYTINNESKIVGADGQKWERFR